MRRLLYTICCLLVVVTGCAANDYNYFGTEVLWTPYDSQYRRIEEHLQRRSTTEVAHQPSPAPFSPPAPVSAAPPATIHRP